MKRIDIHTKETLGDNEVRYSTNINEDLIKQYVDDNSEVPLTTPQWTAINDAFSECWNNKIGIGGEFYNDEIVDFVYEKVRLQDQLLSHEKVNIIVNLMLTKIENDGGFLD
jgi:hypothetical protein